MAKKLICTTCGSVGTPKKRTKGSFLIELALWIMLIIPGIIYSLWRLTTKEKVCRQCGSTELVPPESPVGQRMLR